MPTRPGSVAAANKKANERRPGVVVSACRVIVVFLPLAFLGKFLFGIEGLFAATTLSNLAMGAVAWAWLGRTITRARQPSGSLPPTA